MTARLTLCCAMLLIAGLTALAQTDEQSPKPLHISSRGTSFGVQIELAGTYRVQDASIEIDVDKATLYVSEHCPYQGRRSINFIRLGLARNIKADGAWDIAKRAVPLDLSLTMKPGEEYTLYGLHFSVPIEPETDLTKHWLVVEIQTDALDDPRNSDPNRKNLRGYVFAHTCRCIFAQPCEAQKEEKR